jgi:signal transduction histidine kinase
LALTKVDGTVPLSLACMGRAVVTVVVVLVDAAWLFPGGPSSLPGWVGPIYALAIVVAMALGWRRPAVGFVVAVALACLPLGASALLVWSAYQAGHRAASRSDASLMAAGAFGYLGAPLALGSSAPDVPNVVIAKLVFLVALPMAVGGYLAQHRRLVAALDSHNRQLHAERRLLAERERLRERLRIARDVHDSLGHRLSLVSVQAAALEVQRLPEPQHQAVRTLASAARTAMDELHELVGTLHQPTEEDDGLPGLGDLDRLASEFRAAGLPVTLQQQGEPQPLPAAAGQAAYRVIEEGLTNATKHARRGKVAVSLEWESDALLLDVVSGLPDVPDGSAGRTGHDPTEHGSTRPPMTGGDETAGEPVGRGRTGYGLSGLAARVRSAGGLLSTTRSTVEFRLTAMLPFTMPPADDPTPPPAVERARRAALGFAAVALTCLVVSVTGVR